MESNVGDFRRNLQNASISHFAWLLQFKVRSIFSPYDNMACPSLRYKSQKYTGMLFSALLIQFLVYKIQSWWKPDGLSVYPVFVGWLYEGEARMHVALAICAQFNLWQILELMFFIFAHSLHRITSIRPTSSFKIPSYSSFINHPII